MDWEIYKPGIVNYKPFYIQTAADDAAWDTLAEFGMVAKSNPIPLLPDPKEPYNNEWADHNGDDEYTAVMYYEAFEYSVSFFIKTYTNTYGDAHVLLRKQVRAFFDKVKSGEFKVYDSYTGIGYQNVRYAGYEEESFLARKDWAKAVITIKFKVNDPVTAMGYSGGKITEG